MRTLVSTGALCAVLTAMLALTPADRAWAQGRQAILGDVEIMADPGCTIIRVGFDIPVIYVRHFPYESGKMLLVFVSPAGMGPLGLEEGFERQWASLPPSGFSALEDVVFEGDAPGGPYLSLSFTEKVSWDVQQGRDYRSVVIAIPEQGATEPCPRKQ